MMEILLQQTVNFNVIQFPMSATRIRSRQPYGPSPSLRISSDAFYRKFLETRLPFAQGACPDRIILCCTTMGSCKDIETDYNGVSTVSYISTHDIFLAIPLQRYLLQGSQHLHNRTTHLNHQIVCKI